MDSEVYDFESKKYLSPTVSRDEQMDFINALQNNISQNNAQITQQTRDLGTQIPSIKGGLTGSEGYFAQRYQTPQMEATASQLKATAQAKALEDLMGNYKSQWANRVQQAYRNAKRRASSGGGNDGGGGGGDIPQEEPLGYDQSSPLSVAWTENSPNTHTFVRDGYTYTTDDANGGIYYTDDPDYAKGSDNYYYRKTAAEQRRENMSFLDRTLLNWITTGLGGITGGGKW